MALSMAALTVVTAAHAQSAPRKPGLWEITTTMTQPAPTRAGAPANGMSTVSQVCATKEEFDKYGTFKPRMDASCQLADIVKHGNDMTANLVCSGRMKGQGTLESISTDSEHTHSKAHFTGVVQMGADSHPLEWTSESTAVFKSADCGAVKSVQLK